MSELIFHEDRARRFVDILYRAYVERKHLFRHIHAQNRSAPQHKHIPRGMEAGSQEHIGWLFPTTLLNYRSVSDYVFPMLCTLHRTHPGLFTEDVCRMSDTEITEALLTVGYTSPNQGAYRWKRSMQTLYTHFGGDPMGIYKQVKSVDDFLKLKGELRDASGVTFTGYGPKIFSLLSIFYEELGLIEHIDGTFPIDIHIQRIFISLGIVEGTGKHDAADMAEFIRSRLVKLCYGMDISPVDMSHTLWFLGSYVCTICTKITCGMREGLCPVAKECSGYIDSMAYHRTGRWDLDKIVPRVNHDDGLLTRSFSGGVQIQQELGLLLLE